jgi:hypothetical protein
MIALKDGPHKLLKECDEYKVLDDLTTLNIDATSVFELNSTINKNWLNMVCAPDKYERQQLLSQKLKDAILHHELSEWDLSSLASSPANSPSGGSSSSFNRLNSSNSNDSSNRSDTSDSVHGPRNEVDTRDEK